MADLVWDDSDPTASEAWAGGTKFLVWVDGALTWHGATKGGPLYWGSVSMAKQDAQNRANRLPHKGGFVMWNETLTSPGDYVVNFSLNQKLPQGYTVQWWDCDERYHWVKSADVYGVGHWDRFACRRGAWAHYKAQENEPSDV